MKSSRYTPGNLYPRNRTRLCFFVFFSNFRDTRRAMAEELYKLEKERENVMVKVIIIDAVNVWVSIGRLVSETISLAFLILGRCTRLYFSQIWSVLFPSMVRTRWRVRASVGPEVGGRGGGARMGFFTNYLIPMFLHRQDRILPFNFLILFLRATGWEGWGERRLV